MDAEQDYIRNLSRTSEPKNSDFIDDVSLDSGHFTDADMDILKSPNKNNFDSKEHQTRVDQTNITDDDFSGDNLVCSNFRLSLRSDFDGFSSNIYNYNSPDLPSTSKVDPRSIYNYSNNGDLSIPGKNNHVNILNETSTTTTTTIAIANRDFDCSGSIKINNSDDATDNRKENNIIRTSGRPFLHQPNNNKKNLASEKSSVPCSTKGALIAKQNRQKKKSYLQNLENQVKILTKENNELKQENQKHVSQRERDKDQIDYLNNIMANTPAISRALDAMSHIPAMKKMGLHSETNSKNDEYDATSSGVSPSNNNNNRAGICLHFKPNTDHISLQYCFICSQSSQMSLNHAQQQK